MAAYRPSDAYLLDRNGLIIDERRVNLGVRRDAWTRLRDVSPALLDALVRGEDRRFWRHHGVDWLSVAGALHDDLLSNRRRGASTITMQLASLLASPDRSHGKGHGFLQKLAQMRSAYAIEARWSKREILEAYINLLEFRGELQGIGAAAAVLAHKAPSGLSAAESQVFAALLPSPAAPSEHVAARACARAVAAHVDTPTCATLHATAATLLGTGIAATPADRLAPQLASELLHAAGEQVRTTLDAAVQRLAIGALEHQLAGLGTRNVRDGAAIVVDNASGDILAYVGSAGPASTARYVDGVRARRQAGSTLKPFLYELALERRYLTAASLLDDSPLNLETISGTYIPQDYDHDFKGLVSVRTALGGSLNVPAVRTLVLVGVEAFRDRLHELGYAGITREGQYYGYSLALGSAEVSLFEQAQAYSSLARGGQWLELRLLPGDPRPAPRQYLSPPGTFIVADVLSDASARVVTFGLDSALSTRYWSGAKTGTSKDMRDNWCVGFTSRYTVAVWVGNFEGDPMHDVSGITGAAPAWREILDGLETGGNVAPLRPPGVHAQSIHYAAGVESPRTELFIDGTAPGSTVANAALGAQLPRLTNPANGMIIALDPDIPADRQRVLISAQGGSPDLLVRADDTIVGRAGRAVLWVPRPGAHRIALEQRSGQVVDRILVTVR